MQVLLGGHDLGVTHAFHHGLEVGAAGEEPGGVGVAEVVDADVEVESGVLQCWQQSRLSGAWDRAVARRRSGWMSVPVLVMPPCEREAPEEDSVGTRPR